MGSQPLPVVANCPDTESSTKDRQDVVQGGQWRLLLAGGRAEQCLAQNPVRECQHFRIYLHKECKELSKEKDELQGQH